VFVDQKKNTDLVSQLLMDINADFIAVPFHGGLSGTERAAALAYWESAPNGCLVATSLAERGLNFPDISAIVHLCFRKDPRSLYQANSRGARDGRICTVVMCTHLRFLESFVHTVSYAKGLGELGLALEMAVYLFSNDACRRASLLRLIGDELHTELRCTTCDVCNEDMKLRQECNRDCDMTKPARALFTVVRP